MIDEGIISEPPPLEGDLKSRGMNAGGGQGVTIPPPFCLEDNLTPHFSVFEDPKDQGRVFQEAQCTLWKLN